MRASLFSAIIPVNPRPVSPSLRDQSAPRSKYPWGADWSRNPFSLRTRGYFAPQARGRPTAALFSQQLEKWGNEPAGTRGSAPPCALYLFDYTTLYHAFIGDFSILYRHRTLSATAPLPLAGALNSAYGSTVDIVSGSGASGMSIRHTLR